MLMVETKQMYDNNGTLSPTKTVRPVTGGFTIAFYWTVLFISPVIEVVGRSDMLAITQ